MNDYIIEKYIDGIPVKKYSSGKAQGYYSVDCEHSAKNYDDMEDSLKMFKGILPDMHLISRRISQINKKLKEQERSK